MRGALVTAIDSFMVETLSDHHDSSLWCNFAFSLNILIRWQQDEADGVVITHHLRCKYLILNR